MLEHHQWLSLVPPLAAVALAFWLHRVIQALFLGILSACAILLADRWWVVPAAALDQIVATAVVPDNLRLIVFSVLIGGLVALLKDARAFESFARIIERSRRGLSRRTVYGLTLVLGCTLFLETWSNVLISGTTLRGLYDRLGISRERMAYFLHTVSISVVALVPINSWAAFYMGLLRAQGIERPFQFLLGSVPFVLYCWTNLLLIALVMARGWTFGPMARFERAARARVGAIPASSAPDATDGSRWGAAILAITLCTLIGTVLLTLTVTGNGDPRDGNGAIAVLYAVIAAIAVAALVLKLRGTMRFAQIEERVLAGSGEFIGVAVMVVLALALGALIKELGTGTYVAALFESTLPRPLFAPLIFLVGACMSFATGTSYGTFAIMTPFAIPLALQSGADPHLLFGACIAGGVFGDNTSPISDTSIVTSVATEAKLLDHVATQLPYALVSASVAALGFLGLGIVLDREAVQTYDLWIKGGMVYDGSGAAARRADVLIRGDRIVRVGDVATANATRVIDARGRAVAPGFIDTHAHGDPLEDPSFENFVQQGVTTVVLGQDGRTPGYARESGTDDDIPDGGRKTLADWMNAVEIKGVQTNVVALVGHGTLRLQSGVDTSAQPSTAQTEKMQALLRDGLQAGAYGMSSGLEYVPGRYAQRDELVGLADIVGASGGVVMSHMRTEDSDRIASAVEELAAQGQHAHVHVSHMKIVFAKSPQEGDALIALLEAIRGRGVAMTADVYPYLAGYGDLSLLYPPWAKTREEWTRALATDRARLAGYLRDRIALRGGADAILLADAPFANKTLAAVAAEKHLSPESLVLDLGFGGPNAAHFVMRQDVQDRLIAWPEAAISTDGGPWVRHPRSWGTYPKVLQEHVRERGLMTLQQALRKMTSLPAQIVGLRGRGEICEGCYADLVVFSPEAIRSTATWTQPAQAPTGIDAVIINGCVQVEAGHMLRQNCGRLLRKTGGAENQLR